MYFGKEASNITIYCVNLKLGLIDCYENSYCSFSDIRIMAL